MFDVLRQMVREEVAASPGFALGRMEEPVNSQKAASFRGATSNAEGVRVISPELDPQPLDNGLFVHLGSMRAVGFWRASHVSVGGADPQIISV